MTHVCGMFFIVDDIYYQFNLGFHVTACKPNPTLPFPGDLAPHLGRPLVGVFLQGTKDADQSVRASSLSNLGELCQRMNYALGPLAQEVTSSDQLIFFFTFFILASSEKHAHISGFFNMCMLLMHTAQFLSYGTD